MSHTSRDTMDEIEKRIDEEQAIASPPLPLSELTAQRPVEESDASRQTHNEQRRREEEGQREEEEQQNDDNIPLAEITSEPPVERVAEPSPPRHPSTTQLPPLSGWATKLYTVSYLIFFAIFGTLARLGLQALTEYPGAPVVTGVLWANVGGCILMGFFIEDRNIFREEWGAPPQPPGTSQQQQRRRRQGLHRQASTASEHKQRSAKHKTVKKSIPLYIGLTTGFCGSFTSFSSFMRDAFLALANYLADPTLAASTASPPSGSGIVGGRAKGDSFMAVVAVLALTVSASIAGFYLGAHIALALDPWMPTVPFRFTRNVLDRLFVLLGWGCWLGAVVMSIWPPAGNKSWRSDALFAIVFAPLGCLFRFYMSLLLNARIPAFPLGTFAVNIIGTGVLGMCYDLQHVSGIGALAASDVSLWGVAPTSPPSRSSLFGLPSGIESIYVSCQVLQGVMDGFCGAGTTVSTWVAELTSIGAGGTKRRRFAWAYLYAGVSMGVALALLVAVMGSVRWSRGFDTPYC